MCLMTYFPPGVQPDVECLRNGSVVNDDGHGYAIIIDDEIIVGRSMSFDEIVTEFVALRAEYPDGEAMFHSRYSTCGAYNVDNVHPFEVNRSPLTVLAHNGHITQATPEKGDWRVDSRIFAEDVLPRRFPVLDSPRTQRRLAAYLTSYNKLVILTVDPRYAKRAYIINEKSGTWHDGAWYSNGGYLPSLRSVVGTRYGDWTDWDDDGNWVKVNGKWHWRRSTGDRSTLSYWEARMAELETPPTGSYATGGREGYTPPLSATFSGTAGAQDALDAVGESASAARRAIAATPWQPSCGFCGSDDVNEVMNVCRSCETCLDCCETVSDCLCYMGNGGWQAFQKITCGICGEVNCECTTLPVCDTVECPGFQVASRCPGCTGCDAVCFCGEDDPEVNSGALEASEVDS